MNMIKRTLQTACVSLFILSFVVFHAAEVGENEILLAARKWIEGNAVFQAELPNAIPEKAVQMADFEGKTMPLWRVDLLPTGYLVMAADDTLPPVVAFNTNGAFDMPAAHPLPAMLNRQGVIFQEELAKPKTRGNKLAEENQSRWNGLLGRTRADSVTPSTIITQPLLTTIWNQYAPYDYVCPTNGSYVNRGITGCVPTAFSQILKWHEWPPKGEGTASWSDKEGDVKGELWADYSFPYEWELMRDNHIDNWRYSSKLKDYYYPRGTIDRSDWAIARMMMEMGVYSEADYEQNGTGAYSYKFKTLLANHLMYAGTAEYGDINVGYIGYTDQKTLYARIRRDMVAGRPAALSYRGHSFVGDGLGTMGGLDYYHLNYGWGGSHNGWYLLTDGYNSTVIITATTGIMPRPVAVFKPMSVEQPASFTLSWDFPKRLTAEGFRLTRITGDHSFVVSSSIDGSARSYDVTGQSGTATYTLEAMIDGNWQEVSEGVTVTVKTNPTPMLDLMIDDELNSVAGMPFTTTVAANNTLKSLSVACSRPDMVPDSSISVTGTGTYRTVSLKPSKDLVGNAILYLTAVDSAGNIAQKTVLLRVQENTSVWQTSYSDAQMNALLKGKLILLLAGRETDSNCNYFRKTVCEDADVKANLLANYELWFADVDASAEYDSYVDDLGNTLPWIAIIDPAVQNERLRAHGGPVTIPVGRALLDKVLPYFSLQDELLPEGTTQSLELSVLDKHAEIRYRLDAKAPTANDLLYEEPISLTGTTTISARAFKYGVAVSDTVTKTYTFLPQVATPILNVGEQKYFSDIFLVTAFCQTSDAKIRYTMDGTIPTESSPVFPTGELVVTEDTMLAVRAFKAGMKPSECVFSHLYDLQGLTKGDDIEVVGEETDWFRQTATYKSAPSAMQSRAVGDYGVATMTVKAYGSGTLSYYWKVSSEENKDLLSFSIDNVQRASISGNVNWAQKSFTITGDGEHMLVWTYAKNYRNAAGSDCGWVDDIVWTPAVGKKLVSIAINGASNIAIADTEIYVCMATWDDGSTSPVTPTWSLSSNQYAVLSNGRVTNKNTTEVEQTVALEATYTSGGVTKAAVKNIALAKRGVASIAISGDTNIANGGTSNYVCTATMSDGETADITPVWSLSSTQYASVDADGIVTNRNTTEKDQTVTLTADYTSGDVARTASIVLTLIKRTLVSISITGDNEIAGGETAPYVCTATWSDGAAMPVTPSWSLSSTQHASVDASGKVTNRNVTETNQSVTLTASYTSGGVTLTASKSITLTNRFLVSIAIAGDNVVATAVAAAYGCTATWSDGANTDVKATWSLSSNQYASVDTDGKLTNKNATDNDQTVTLTASYTSGGVTMTVSRVVTLAKRTLTDIAIAGDAAITNAASATYECAAVWSVGESTAVSATWSLSSTQYASVDAAGKVTNKNTSDSDQTVTLTARYTHDGVTKTATKAITLAKRYLSSIAIEGNSIIPNGGTATYSCTATWSDGTTSSVTATWSLSATQYATVDADGKVVNKNTLDTDQTVTLNASYTADGVTQTASKVISLTNRSLVSISIAGDSAIPSGVTTTYSCEATWSDGATTTVSPTWSISTTTFATVDAAGKVLNMNATDRDQAVTLTAVCQAGDVTKTATKAITLAKRTFESITIEGDGAIAAGDASNYVCMVNWSVGEPTEVKAVTWSLSSTANATVDIAGKVMNRNTTEVDQTVTLNAAYTHEGVTKTGVKTIVLTKRLLLELAISGNAAIGSGQSVAYLCEAKWSDSATTAVNASWSLSSTDYASVDANGKVKNMNTTEVDQTVTLTVNFTSGGETKTVSKEITLAKRTLADLSVTGDSAISNGFTSAYECKATWSDGTTSLVTPKWTLSSTLHASLDSTGRVTNKNTTAENQTVTLVADFASGGVAKTATKAITMVKRTLRVIAVNGDAVIPNNESASYSCVATWSDNTMSEVEAVWSISSTEYAALDANGKVSNRNTTDTDQTVTITATFVYGDVTKTASKSIRLTKRTLLSITVAGDEAIPNGGSAVYTCTPTWSDGETVPVEPTWSLSSTEYAAVDATGKVTNLNKTDTDQTVKLTASCTFAGVTRTASVTILLAKRTLVDIAIDGPAAIANNKTATYSCTATWNDSTTSVVMAAWSLSSTMYASVDANGRVSNQNASGKDQTVTLNASYTYGGVTKTTEKTIALTNKTIESIAVNGKSSIAAGSTASYSCIATWSDATTSVITPVWSLSSTDYASVNATGKVTNQNMTEAVQTVTLIANYTFGDKTLTSEKDITLSKRTLKEIAIDGVAEIASGGAATYVCMATWNVGDPTPVSPVWTLSSTDYAVVDADGKVTNRNMTADDQTVTLTASYTFDGVAKKATKVITLAKRTLEAIAVEGETEILNEQSQTFVCTATWSDGETAVVTPEWTLSATDYASIDAVGNVTNKNTTDDDQSVTLTANYTYGDVTKTASKSLTLKGLPQPTQILELRPGWNMVTVVKTLASKPDGVHKFLELKPIMQDIEHHAFVICGKEADVKAGVGYWVFSRQSQTVELVQDKEQAVQQPQLQSGWNFVGMTEDSDWMSSAIVIWGWRNGRFVQVEKEDLQIGCAYWIYR